LAEFFADRLVYVVDVEATSGRDAGHEFASEAKRNFWLHVLVVKGESMREAALRVAAVMF